MFRCVSFLIGLPMAALAALLLGPGSALGHGGGHGGGGHGGGGHFGGGHMGGFGGGFHHAAPAHFGGAVHHPGVSHFNSFGGAVHHPGVTQFHNFGGVNHSFAPAVHHSPTANLHHNFNTTNFHHGVNTTNFHHGFTSINTNRGFINQGRHFASNRFFGLGFFPGFYGGYYPGFYGFGFFPGYYGGLGYGGFGGGLGALTSLALLGGYGGLGYGGFGYGGLGYGGYGYGGYGGLGGYGYGGYGSGYYAPSTGGYGGPLVASAPPTPPADGSALNPGDVLFRVHVPPTATVWVNGVQTTQTGEYREFISSDLAPGRTYTYTVRAKWSDGGFDFDQTRKVKVQGGEVRVVDFAAPPNE